MSFTQDPLKQPWEECLACVIIPAIIGIDHKMTVKSSNEIITHQFLKWWFKEREEPEEMLVWWGEMLYV